jgi:hypothetical protein
MATGLRPAKTEREWWALLKSGDKTFIRSMSDWKAALADPKNNPLKGCDPKAVQKFTKSLKFSNGGLAHANYGPIVEQMSYSQFSGLWGRFGLGMILFEDHNNMACTKRATCTTEITSICTSNC